MKTQKQVIISIGREFGSAGHEIAERIAKRYGLSLYDHNLLREVADSHNVNPEELEIFDEMKHNKFLYRTVKGMSSSPARQRCYECSSIFFGKRLKKENPL